MSGDWTPDELLPGDATDEMKERRLMFLMDHGRFASAKCPICAIVGIHAHGVSDLVQLRKMVTFLESKLGLPLTPTPADWRNDAAVKRATAPGEAP